MRPATLLFEVHVGQRLPVVILHDEAGGVRLLNVPRRWVRGGLTTSLVPRRYSPVPNADPEVDARSPRPPHRRRIYY